MFPAGRKGDRGEREMSADRGESGDLRIPHRRADAESSTGKKEKWSEGSVLNHSGGQDRGWSLGGVRLRQHVLVI